MWLLLLLLLLEDENDEKQKQTNDFLQNEITAFPISHHRELQMFMFMFISLRNNKELK